MRDMFFLKKSVACCEVTVERSICCFLRSKQFCANKRTVGSGKTGEFSDLSKQAMPFRKLLEFCFVTNCSLYLAPKTYMGFKFDLPLMPPSIPLGLLAGNMYWAFAAVLIGYASLLMIVGFVAQKRIKNVEDYVLAGRKLKTGLATITMIATWFGAESLMTTTDEVAQQGLRKAMLDPVGISMCLMITGLFVAGPLWRMGLMTIPDFFRSRYGKLAESMSACILVPSYFGWIAAQYLALATLLDQFFGVPVVVGVIGVAVLAMSYSLMGGMWSVTWTDAIQMLFIVLGLLILGFEILWQLGDKSVSLGWTRLRFESDPAMWMIAVEPDSKAKVMGAISALVIGSLGNLPVQDLMQRICSSASDRVARRACLLAAIGYLCMGMLPILAGLSASQLLGEVPADGVLTALAERLLGPGLLLIFVLAVVSTVLSTVVSAVLAPAAVLSQNLLLPLAQRFNWLRAESSRLVMQRVSVLVIAAVSVLFALSGSDTYSLVESSYSLSLVGMFAGFAFGLYNQSAPRAAALASMVVGIGLWLLHVSLGWENFLQPIVNPNSSIEILQLSALVPHELGDTLLSVIAFLVLWGILGSKKQANV